MSKVKVISLIIVFTLIFSISSVGFGATDNKDNRGTLTKDEAKKIVEDKLGIKIDDKDANINMEYRDYEYQEEATWFFYLLTPVGNLRREINVTIGAESKKILSMYMYEYNMPGRLSHTITQYTEEEAKMIAEEFIKTMEPDKISIIEHKPNNYYRGPYFESPVMYNFRYVMKYDGIQFDTNNIYVTVNGATGKVTQYSYNWQDVEFPSKKSVISEERALELYKENIEMDLQYRARYEEDYTTYIRKLKGVDLVYYPKIEGYGIDAKTGKWLTYEHFGNYKLVKPTEEELKEILANYKPLAKEPKELSKEEVEEIAKKYLSIISDNVQIRSSYKTRREWENNRDVWYIDWTVKADKSDEVDGENGSLEIDGNTGEIVALYIYSAYDYNEDFEPKLSWENGYRKAIESIVKIDADKVKELNFEVMYYENKIIVDGVAKNPPTYSYHFRRNVNGIDYLENYIYIDISAKTGNILSYSKSWTENIEFPKAKNIITQQKAMNMYLEKNPIILRYIMLNNNLEGQKPELEVKLTYSPEYTSFNNIDAFSGKFVDYEGNELVEESESTEFNEILKNHKNARELSIMAAQRIIDKKTFKPDEDITKLDFIKTIVKGRGFDRYIISQMEPLKFTDIEKNSEEYNYIQGAISLGIIENEEIEFRGDSKITREELAVLLVKLTGYEELAKAQDIFKLDYSDAMEISNEMKSYVAIAKGLNILDGENGKFNAKANVTMAEAVVAIYKAIPKMINAGYRW